MYIIQIDLIYMMLFSLKSFCIGYLCEIEV